MTWGQVPATVDQLLADDLARDRILSDTIGWKEAPVRGLRALLWASKENGEAAWSEVMSLAPELVPPAMAYAMWRLGMEANVGVENRFWIRTLEAVQSGDLSGLAAARVHALNREWNSALQQYLASDPAAWTTFDIDILREARRLASWRQDAGTVVLAALKGGRIPVNLRRGFSRLIAPSLEPEEARSAWLRYVSGRDRTPELMQAGHAAVRTQLDIRQRFARRDFVGVLTEMSRFRVTEVGDELLLLATLAAAAEADGEAWRRWSSELRRRNPQPEVTTWLRQIATEKGL